MDGTRLQSKLYAGYAKAAKRIGMPYQVFRPMTWNDPLADGPIATIPAAFTIHSANQFAFDKPSDHKNALYHCLADGSQIAVGDYLINEETGDGTFFIASKDNAVPIFAIECNVTLSAYNPGPVLNIGANAYAGTTQANETPILINWPASALLGARGVRDQTLPADAGYGSWRILMPAWSGVTIRPGTILNDDIGNRMVVQSAELQDLGWRIDATQMVT